MSSADGSRERDAATNSADSTERDVVTNSPDRNGLSTDSSSLPTRPASKRIYIAAAVLSLVGLGDSIYLTVKHLTGQTVQCTISTGCEEVLGSAYATLFGYPLAAFGALAYFTAFSLATLALFGYRRTRTLLIIVVGFMTLMTLRLLYIQAFVLGKYCEFCLLSAAITLLLAGLMLANLFWSGNENAKPKEQGI